MITDEEKFLRDLYADILNTGPVRQELVTTCFRCRHKIDVTDYEISIDFVDIIVGNIEVTLLQPHCPNCGLQQESTYYVVH